SSRRCYCASRSSRRARASFASPGHGATPRSTRSSARSRPSRPTRMSLPPLRRRRADRIGPMKIAALQMVSTPSVERNLNAARRLVAEAAASGAELVALPEYFCFMGASDRDKLAIAEAPGDGPIQQALADMAREQRVWIIGGTVPIRTESAELVLNTSC